jgi:hypothetical protein
MMTNLGQIRKKLIRPSGYAIIPKTQINSPLPFPEWEIEDENGGTGEYYSPQTLSNTLGKLLVLIDYIDDRFFLMRYGMDWDTVPQVTGYLQSIGLTHIRDNGDSTLKTTAELDYSLFDGTEFMIIPPYMIQDVPKQIVEEEA